MSKLAQLSPTQAKPTVKVAELIVKEDELSYEQIFQFVKQHAGGNEGNVNIVPLPNVDLDNKKTCPIWIWWQKRRCESQNSKYDT